MKHLLIGPLVLLAACTSPRDACISDAATDLRVVKALIADTKATIERGYAIQTETRTVIYTNFCVGTGVGSNGRFSFCNSAQPVTSRVPVAVDLNAERRKLASLKEKETELTRSSALRQQRCELQYPAKA